MVCVCLSAFLPKIIFHSKDITEKSWLWTLSPYSYCLEEQAEKERKSLTWTVDALAVTPTEI